MIEKFENIKSQVLNSPQFVKNWEEKFSIFCDNLIKQGFDLNCEKSNHNGNLFEDKLIKCPRINLDIELGMDNEYRFKMDGENAHILTVARKMFKKKHICTNNNFWKKYQENNGIGQLRLGLFLIPLAFTAISSLLTLAAGAGVVAMVNSKKEKEKLLTKPPKNITDSSVINNNQIRITTVIYYFENIINAFQNLPVEVLNDSDDIDESPFEMIPTGDEARNNENLEEVINQTNSKPPPILNSGDLVDVFDFERVNNDKEDVLRILNNPDQLPAIADFLENTISTNINSFNSGNRADLEGLLDDINEVINNRVLTPIELEKMQELRRLIIKRLDGVIGIPHQETREIDRSEESDDDDYIPFNIVPIWSRDWNETATNKLNLKEWLRYGDIIATPLQIFDYSSFDYIEWIKKTFITNSQSLYPWNDINLYAIYDYRFNKEENKGVAHIYFQEN